MMYLKRSDVGGRTFGECECRPAGGVGSHSSTDLRQFIYNPNNKDFYNIHGLLEVIGGLTFVLLPHSSWCISGQVEQEEPAPAGVQP